MNVLYKSIVAANAGTLEKSFTLTIEEFHDNHVINPLKIDSRGRGYCSCKAYDDDGSRNYYADDPIFVAAIARAAVQDISGGSTFPPAGLIEFLENGGLKPDISIEEADIIGGGWRVEYAFENVDWDKFDWEGALAEYDGTIGETPKNFVDSVNALLDEIRR